MKILFIAFPESIHTARWINQLSDMNWDIHLIPSSQYFDMHKELNDITLYRYKFGIGKLSINKGKGAFSKFFFGGLNYGSNIINELINISKTVAAPFINRFTAKMRPELKADKQYKKEIRKLARLIKKINPDIIHTLETQHAGYMAYDVKQILGDSFPQWIHTNWGADLHLFGQLAEHKEKIRNVLSSCDYYSCECYRDVEIAQELGLKAKVLPIFPNTGGFDIAKSEEIRSNTPPSKRKRIMLKGYQGWAGRSLVGIRALERCADILNGYDIMIYLGMGCPEVVIAAELLENRTGIPVKMIPYCSHEEILKLHGESRISIGLSITDAISTSMLEAMLMGSFPIQSNTACVQEWAEDGKSVLIVPPEDPEQIEKAIRKALSDDALVDSAAGINKETAIERLDKDLILQKVKDFYWMAVNESRSKESRK